MERIVPTPDLLMEKKKFILSADKIYLPLIVSMKFPYKGLFLSCFSPEKIQLIVLRQVTVFPFFRT